MKRILAVGFVLLFVSAAWAAEQPHRTLKQRRYACQQECRQDNATVYSITDTEYNTCVNGCLERMLKEYGPAKPVKRKTKDTDKNKN